VIVFDAVQAKLNEQRTHHTVMRGQSEALLIGRIYDNRGNRMIPSHVRKGGIKYRYYLSSPLLHGQPGRSGSMRRVPAAEIEALVASAVRKHIEAYTESDDRDLMRNHVVRVDLQVDQAIGAQGSEGIRQPAHHGGQRSTGSADPMEGDPNEATARDPRADIGACRRATTHSRRDPRHARGIDRAWPAMAG
jgi:hypothetical protein